VPLVENKTLQHLPKTIISYFYQMTAQKAIILLRGLPGAGKSTLAEVLANGKIPVFAIDDYFTKDGVYQFRHEENHLAYKQCERQTAEAMKNGEPRILVDNTFTMDWEMDPYFNLASEYGYCIFVITVENRHGGANSHGVSREQLFKMAEKYKVILY
jgi:predicted kinase